MISIDVRKHDKTCNNVHVSITQAAQPKLNFLLSQIKQVISESAALLAVFLAETFTTLQRKEQHDVSQTLSQ